MSPISFWLPGLTLWKESALKRPNTKVHRAQPKVREHSYSSSWHSLPICLVSHHFHPDSSPAETIKKSQPGEYPKITVDSPAVNFPLWFGYLPSKTNIREQWKNRFLHFQDSCCSAAAQRFPLSLQMHRINCATGMTDGHGHQHSSHGRWINYSQRWLKQVCKASPLCYYSSCISYCKESTFFCSMPDSTVNWDQETSRRGAGECSPWQGAALEVVSRFTTCCRPPRGAEEHQPCSNRAENDPGRPGHALSHKAWKLW